MSPAGRHRRGGQQVLACPTYHGGKDWEAGACSPLTNTMYMPLRNTCGRMLAASTGAEDDLAVELYSLVVRHELTPGDCCRCSGAARYAVRLRWAGETLP